MKPMNFILSMAMLACVSCGSDGNDTPNPPVGPVTPTEGPQAPTEVIYQANPRFFATNNCLDAITAQIGNISDMGCDILWVMPVQQPGEKKAVGSPYCIRDYKSVNTKYGTMTDFRELVNAAHAKGMKVILDWVANHTSWDNAWITEHPEYYAKDNNGNIVQASTWSDVAQLDYSNANLRKEMIDAMVYWVNETGIDGFRCDYTNGVPHDFWSSAIKTLRGINPDIIMLAETSFADFYNDGFDMIYDWDFAPAMTKTFAGGKVSDLYDKEAASWKQVPEDKDILRYAFNHDYAAENAIDKSYGSADGVYAAYVLTAMLHGTPMIYSSMDADNVSGKLSFFNYNPLTWSASKRAVYKKINDAFKASAKARGGELTTYNNDDVAVFTRTSAQQTALVMVNTTGSSQTVKTPITYAGVQMTEQISGTQVAMPTAVTLEPYGYRIYLK